MSRYNELNQCSFYKEDNLPIMPQLVEDITKILEKEKEGLMNGRKVLLK